MHADAFELDSEAAEPQARDPNRDPREDPQPGDVLAVGDDVREVIDRVQGSIEYGFPNRAATRWLALIRWQVWARHAEVRKVAL